MKKISFILSMVLLLFLFVKCEEEPIQPEPEPQDSTVVVNTHIVRILNSDGGTISPSGNVRVNDSSDLTINFTSYPGYKIDSAYVNDTLVTVKDNALVLENIALDYKVEGVFKLTDSINFLTNSQWDPTHRKITIVESGEVFENDLIGNKNVFSIFYYPYDGQSSKMDIFFPDDDFVGNGEYELIGDSLIHVGSQRFKILKLSADSLVMKYLTPYGNEFGIEGYELRELTYKHPGSY